MTTNALAVNEPQKTAIAVAPPNFAQPKTLAEVREVAEVLLASKFFKDVNSAAQACVKMIAGMALGYDAVTSMNAFHIIEGKITPTAGEISARIKRSGTYRFKSWFVDATGAKVDPTQPDSAVNGAVVQIYEKWDDTWEPLEPSVFTRQDAITASLASKDVWKKYFRNMSHSRALTNAARWHCADVFGGPVYTPEELGADVGFVDGEMVVIDKDQTLQIPKDPTPTKIMNVDQLKAAYIDARKLRPDLPEDIKDWAEANIAGYKKDRPPTKKMALEMATIVETMLAEGGTVAEAVQGELLDPEPDTDIAKQKRAEQRPPVAHDDAPAIQAAIDTAEQTGANITAPPPKRGAPISPKTRSAIFGLLGEFDVGVALDNTEAEKEKARKERLEYVESLLGLDRRLMTFNDLSEEQGDWVKRRLQDLLFCVACRAKVGIGRPHDASCPEREQ